MGLQEETADVLGAADPLQHGQPAGRRARVPGVAARLPRRDAGFEASSTAPSPSARTSSRALRGESRRPGARLPLARRHRARRRPRTGRTTRGRGERPRRLPVGPRRARHEVPDRRRGRRRRATLAREGWRPARGELKVIAVVDEEAGGALGAQWLTRAAARRSCAATRCSTRAPAPVIPYGDRRLYGVCCAEKGTFRFARARPRRAPATPRCPALARQRAAQARAALERLGDAPPGYDVTDEPRALLARARRGPRRPGGRAARASRDDRAAAGRAGRADARRHVRADDHRGRREDQRDPRARRAAGRLPRAAGHGRRGDDGARPRGARRRRRRSRSSSSSRSSATARRSSRR